MKTCKCGYKSNNSNLVYCDKCGALLESKEEVVSAPKKKKTSYIYHHHHGISIKAAFLVAILSVSAYLGLSIYKFGAVNLHQAFVDLAVFLVPSLVLIFIVSMITANIMNITFGGAISFCFKMVSVILISEMVQQLIPITFLGPILAFVVFLGLVEYFFDLQWDGLIVFGIFVAVIYILGRLWLEGLVTWLISLFRLGIIIAWRYVITWLTF